MTSCTWSGCCGWTRSPASGVPSIAEEAARDLVRARDDVRGELMRARHRVRRNCLLRQGIVYSDRRAWTLTHDAWLQRQSFE
jgi:hypothetical protein